MRGTYIVGFWQSHSPPTRWMIDDFNFNADKKALPFLDNQHVQHSRSVKAWLAEHTDTIEIFFLPGYCPELYPEERLNVDLTQAIGKKVPVKTKAKLRDGINQHMAMLESNPDRVRYFYQNPGLWQVSIREPVESKVPNIQTVSYTNRCISSKV